MRKYNESLRKISLAISILIKPFFSKKKPFSYYASPQTILVIELHKIGDVVLIIPLLKFLRKKYPKSKLILLGSSFAEDIISGQDIYDDLIIYDAFWTTRKKLNFFQKFFSIIELIRKLKEKKIDLTIDIRGDFRNIFIAHFSNSKSIIGYGNTGGAYLLSDEIESNGDNKHLSSNIINVINFFNTNQEKFEYKPEIKLTNTEISESNLISKYIGINYKGSNDLRTLSYTMLEKILLNILDLNLRIVIFVDSESSGELRLFIEKFNKNNFHKVEIVSLPLRKYIVYLSKAEYLINVDSGPAHLAAALGIPQTTIFGPNEPESVKPVSENISVIFNQNLNCRPCNQIYCTNSEYKKCLSDIKLENMVNPIYII